MMLLDLEHAHYASATLQTLHQFLVYRYVDIIHIVVDMMITVFFYQLSAFYSSGIHNHFDL
jgi:hypothetical protein